MSAGLIFRRVRDVRQRIANAAGGSSDGITLVAASKTMPAALIREAIRAGVDAVGENRVQEMSEKDEQGAYDGAPLHFIGRLQKNKVSKVVGRVELIHSVDSLALAEAIDQCAGRRGIIQPVLAQVNIAKETTKGGFFPENILEALKSMSSLRYIRIRGLMCIPPPLDTQYFVVMRQLYIDIQAKKVDNIGMDFLSMGMSDDFEWAVRAGANMLRIGSSIFGERNRAAAGAGASHLI